MDRCYVVGYSFRDDDILGLFLDALELNTALQILVIDPEAQKIVNNRFERFQARIKLIDKGVSTHAAASLG